MFGLCSDTKFDFNADGFARKESMKGTSVTNFWSPTQKNPEFQKDIATKLDLSKDIETHFFPVNSYLQSNSVT